MLNTHQLAMAQALRADRPAVIPGTNVISDPQQRRAFYDRVMVAMEQVGLGCTTDAMTADQARELTAKVNAFCDAAGVPD